MSWADKEYEKKYRREYKREYRKMLKENHFCINCLKQDDYTRGGSPYCEQCHQKRYEQNKEYKRKNRDVILAKEKARREQRKALGLCTSCGKPAWNNLVTCMECATRDRNRHKAKREATCAISTQIYRELGLCVRCGAPRTDRVTAWGGDPVKLCERCYQDNVRAAKKGRDAYLERNGETWGQTQFNRYQRQKE